MNLVLILDFRNVPIAHDNRVVGRIDTTDAFAPVNFKQQMLVN